jgi:hypothetical protein
LAGLGLPCYFKISFRTTQGNKIMLNGVRQCRLVRTLCDIPLQPKVTFCEHVSSGIVNRLLAGSRLPQNRPVPPAPTLHEILSRAAYLGLAGFGVGAATGSLDQALRALSAFEPSRLAAALPGASLRLGGIGACAGVFLAGLGVSSTARRSASALGIVARDMARGAAAGCSLGYELGLHVRPLALAFGILTAQPWTPTEQAGYGLAYLNQDTALGGHLGMAAGALIGLSRALAVHWDAA